MNEVPEGKNMEGTYERFIASCPWCGRRNVFNRASDLGDFEPIDHKDVSCLFPDCSKPFFLTGDTINPAYEMVIYDCYELIEQKYYAYCILNLCQSFELFFSQYLRVELVYRPFASGVRDERLDLDIRHFNDLRNLLYARLRGLTFEPMRNLFFCLVLRGPGPGSLEEADLAFSVSGKPSARWA